MVKCARQQVGNAALLAAREGGGGGHHATVFRGINVYRVTGKMIIKA